MTDRSLLSKTNLSSAKMLSSISKGDPQMSFMENISSFEEPSLDLQDPIEHEYEEDVNEVSKEEAYDFGYFNLLKEQRPVKEYHLYDTSKSQLNNLLTNKIQQIDKFNLSKMNLISKINKSKKIDPLTKEIVPAINCDQELIFTFARQENDFLNFELPNTKELRTKDVVGATMLSRSAKKEKSTFEAVQTVNSYILRKQQNEIAQGNVDHARRLNYEYRMRKEKYEINLVLKLLKKYEMSSKPGSKTYVEYTQPYYELKRESAKLVEKYKKNSSHDKYTLNNFKIEAINLIKNFIQRIQVEIDDTPVANNEIEVKKFRNYSKWKKKLSELVNIWELFQSNGVQQKFRVKYLIIRRFLASRGKIIWKKTTEETSNFNLNFVNSWLKYLLGTVSSKFIPKSIFMPDDLTTIFIEFVVSMFLIYSLFSIPLIAFLGFKHPSMISLNKYVDVIFYMDLSVNFRRVFKDKANEYIYDLNKIRKNYLKGFFFIDFISAFPWSIFFFNFTDFYQKVMFYIMCLKILRMVKLTAIMDRIEAMKISGYMRLIKLFFLFTFFAHWIGCMLYSTIDVTLDYAGMPDNCYVTNEGKSKDNSEFSCRYLMMIYNSAYIIPGQYTNAMTGLTKFAGTAEYTSYIFVYMIGQVLSAFLFGGVASIVQNLDQGQTFFNNKMEMFNNHMRFYAVNSVTQEDVKIYFNYLWQRHKDVIYGKHHFDLLSKSLREKFERLNLPGNEILLAKFYNLNPGNTKLIGNILMRLSKTILFPYEILFEVGSVLKGVYILMNGDLELVNEYIKHVSNSTFSISYADILTTMQKRLRNKDYISQTYYEEDKSVIFPLVSALIKTGRNWQSCYSENFTDLLFLPLQAFDELIFNFPVEMHILKHKVMEWVTQKKLFENSDIFQLVSQHSSRSVSKYYLKEYDKFSIWINIPIPISQRKIAGNYIDTFVKKVRNQWREILLMGDLNIGLNSQAAVKLLKSSGQKKNDDKNEGKKQSLDALERLKELTKDLDLMTEFISNEFE
jgi:hypothetical protein